MTDDRRQDSEGPRHKPATDRRRLEEIFDRDPGTEDREDEGAREDWYLQNRPPHHDR